MKHNLAPLLIVFLVSALAIDIEQTHSPPNVARISTIWKWCECGKGL